MAKRKKRRMPVLSLHKASGQGRVRINGKDYYCGKFDSDECQARYEALLQEHVIGKMDSVSAKKLTTVLAAWWPECKQRYVGADNWKPLIKLLRENLGKMQIQDIEPHHIENLLQREADARSWSRNYVRDLLRKIRLMFKWARRKGMIDKTMSLEWITECEVRARRTRPKPPVPDEVVDAILPHLKPKLADMVRVQRLTGMRPKEVCIMRGCDIDRSGDVWVYMPQSHKNEWRDMQRTIYIGPQAQKILGPWLLKAADGYLWPTRQTEHYDSDTYRELIKRTVQRVNEERIEKAKEDGSEPVLLACFSPNQLRKNTATRVRAASDVETAASVLGHSSSVVTGNHYADKDQARAVQWVLKHG